jgi:hypothetical protein
LLLELARKVLESGQVDLKRPQLLCVRRRLRHRLRLRLRRRLRRLRRLRRRLRAHSLRLRLCTRCTFLGLQTPPLHFRKL